MHNRLKGLPKSKSVDDEHDADQKLEALNKGRECAATHNSTKSFVSSLRSHGSVSFSTKSIPSSSNRSGASSMKERGRLAQTRFQDFEDMIARVARLQTSPTTVTNSEPAEVPTPINPDKLNSLHRAVWKANFRRFCTLLTERGRNLNKFDRHHGITALHLCAELPGRFDYAKALIACHNERAHNSKWQLFLKKPNVTDRSIRDIDLEAPNPSLRTALCLAVIYGNTPVAKLLLDHGALTNPQDVFGCTPLHYALLNNDVPMFDAILRFGGNVDTLDKTDSTLLHHSILLQNKEITKLIMTSGHNLCNILNRNQKTPLHIAIESRNEDAIKILLDNDDIDTTIATAENETPLQLAHKFSLSPEAVDLIKSKMSNSDGKEFVTKSNIWQGDLISDERNIEQHMDIVEVTDIIELKMPPSHNPRAQRVLKGSTGIDYGKENESSHDLSTEGSESLSDSEKLKHGGDTIELEEKKYENGISSFDKSRDNVEFQSLSFRVSEKKDEQERLSSSNSSSILSVIDTAQLQNNIYGRLSEKSQESFSSRDDALAEENFELNTNEIEITESAEATGSDSNSEIKFEQSLSDLDSLQDSYTDTKQNILITPLVSDNSTNNLNAARDSSLVPDEDRLENATESIKISTLSNSDLYCHVEKKSEMHIRDEEKPGRSINNNLSKPEHANLSDYLVPSIQVTPPEDSSSDDFIGSETGKPQVVHEDFKRNILQVDDIFREILLNIENVSHLCSQEEFTDIRLDNILQILEAQLSQVQDAHNLLEWHKISIKDQLISLKEMFSNEPIDVDYHSSDLEILVDEFSSSIINWSKAKATEVLDAKLSVDKIKLQNDNYITICTELEQKFDSTVIQYEENLSKLEIEKANLENSLNEKLLEKTNEIVNLQTELSNSKLHHEDILDKLQCSLNEIKEKYEAELVNVAELVAKEKEKLSSELAYLKQQNQAKQSQLENFELNFQKMLIQENEHELVVASLNAKLKDYVEEVMLLKQENAQLYNSRMELELIVHQNADLINNTDSEVCKLKLDQEDNNKERQQLLEQLTAQHAKLCMLECDINAKEQIILDKENRVGHLQSEANDLSKDNEVLGDQVHALREVLSERIRIEDDLRTKLSENENLITTMRAENQDLVHIKDEMESCVKIKAMAILELKNSLNLEASERKKMESKFEELQLNKQGTSSASKSNLTDCDINNKEEFSLVKQQLSEVLVDYTKLLAQDCSNEERIKELELSLMLCNQKISDQAQLLAEEQSLHAEAVRARDCTVQFLEVERERLAVQLDQSNSVENEITNIKARKIYPDTLQDVLDEIDQSTSELMTGSDLQSDLDDISELKNKNADRLVGDLQNELLRLTREIENEKIERNSREVEHSKVLKSLSDLEKDLSDLKQIYEHERTSLHNTECERVHLQMEVENLQLLVEEQTETAKIITLELNQARQELMNMREQTDTYKAESLKRENNFQAEYALLSRSFQQIEQKLNFETNSHLSTKDELTLKLKEIEAIRAKTALLEEENCSLKLQVENSISELQQNLSINKQVSAKLETLQIDHENEVKNMDSLLKASKKSADERSLTIRSLHATIEVLKSEICTLIERHKDASLRRDEDEAKIEELSQIICTLEGELGGIKTDNVNKEKELDCYKVNISQIEARYINKFSEIEQRSKLQIEEMIISRAEMQNTLENKLHEANLQLEQLKSETEIIFETLGDKLSKKIAHIKELEEMAILQNKKLQKSEETNEHILSQLVSFDKKESSKDIVCQEENISSQIHSYPTKQGISITSESDREYHITQIETLENQLKQLQVNMDDKSKYYTDELERLSLEKDQIAQELQLCSKDASGHKNLEEHIALRVEFGRVQQELGRVQQELSECKTAKQILVTKAIKIEKDLLTKSQALIDVQASFEEFTHKKCKPRSDTSNAFNEKDQEIEQVICSAEKERSLVKSEVSLLKQQLKRIQECFAEGHSLSELVQEENRQLKSKLSNLESEIFSFKQEASTYRSLIDKMSEQASKDQKYYNEQLEIKREHQVRESTLLQSKIQQLEKYLTELQDRLALRSEEIQSLRTEISVSKRFLSEDTEKRRQLEQENISLRTALNKSEKNFEVVQNEMHQLELRLSERGAQTNIHNLENSTTDFESLKQSVAKMQLKLTEDTGFVVSPESKLRERIVQLEVENAILLEKLREETDRLKSNEKEYRQHTKKLERTVHEKNREINFHREQAEAQRNSSTTPKECTNQKPDLAKEISELRKDVQKYRRLAIQSQRKSEDTLVALRLSYELKLEEIARHISLQSVERIRIERMKNDV